MYTRYYGLRENPFSIPPDPQYLYLSRSHQEALAHLQFGIVVSGGFGQLTGEVGTGKTLLIRSLVQELPDDVEVALILYPVLTVFEFVVAICDELRIDYPKNGQSIKTLIDSLNAHLLENHAKGRRTVLIIDEAQNLSREVLEQIRLLTNLETTKQKLLQIILIGQPELRSLLAQRDLRQLDQRITTRYSLTALSRQETCDYIVHRSQIAGAKTPLLTTAAMRRVHRLSGGIPRLINIICDRALMGAYAQEKNVVDAGLVLLAAAEVGVKSPRRFLGRFAIPMVLASLAAVLVAWQLPGMINMFFTDKPPATEALQSTSITESLPVMASADVSPQPPARKVPVQAPVQAIESAEQGVSAPVVKQVALTTPSVQKHLSNYLKDVRIPTDSDTAMQRLFYRWDIDYGHQSGRTACERALNAGLRCIYDTGTWNNVWNYNRPAVIELVDSNGDRHHVLVSALNRDSVTLALGDSDYDFPLSEVDRYWFGKFLLLWNPQKLNRGNLHYGMRGESVLWLRDVIARYKGAASQMEQSDIFDAELEAQIIEFQKDHHLTADGIVGELTMLKLNSYNPQGRPPMLVDATGTGVE